MKIKVLRIMHRMNVGGPTFHATYLSKYLSKEKYETKLVAGNLDDNEKSGEYILKSENVEFSLIKNMYRKINLIKDIKAYYEIKKIIKEFKPHIVHTHAAKSGTLGRLAALSLNVPVIIHTFHGHVFHSYFNSLKTKLFILIERFLSSKSSKIIAISKLQKIELSEVFKIADKDKVSIISLGFHLERFNDDKARKRKLFRDEFNINDNQIAIGIVGRLVQIKNHKLFLNSIKMIQTKTKKDLRFFIVGDGDERENLENLCQELQLPYNNENDIEYNKLICFTSWRSDLDIINNGLDIMALTSYNEGTPVSLIEAQASCLPIVTTDVGGIRDIVQENVTALISSNNNLLEFSENLLKCINDIQIMKENASIGYDFVKEKFGYKRLINDIQNLYNLEIEKTKSSFNY